MKHFLFKQQFSFLDLIFRWLIIWKKIFLVNRCQIWIIKMIRNFLLWHNILLFITIVMIGHDIYTCVYISNSSVTRIVLHVFYFHYLTTLFWLSFCPGQDVLCMRNGHALLAVFKVHTGTVHRSSGRYCIHMKVSVQSLYCNFYK